MNLYCIKFPNGKLYFGIETNEQARWRVHKCASRQSNPPWAVHRAMKKYGIENCEHRYIYKGIDRDYCIRLEIEFIRAYKTMDSKLGYNMTTGGDHSTPSEEVKIKLSNSIRNHYSKMTAEQRKFRASHLAKMNTGIKRSKEYKENMSRATSGIKKSPDHVAKIAKKVKEAWARRRISGLPMALAYTKHPELKPKAKDKPVRAKKWQRLKPVSDEHRLKVSQKKKEWWAKKKAEGKKGWIEIFDRPKKKGYILPPFTREHRQKLSQNKTAYYAKLQ